MISKLLTFIVWLCLAGTASGSSQELISLKLEHAKEDLRVSIATEKKIESEFNQLKASGNASPEVLTYYETYLERVRAMVEENQKLVHDMEAACARDRGRPLQEVKAVLEDMRGRLRLMATFENTKYLVVPLAAILVLVRHPENDE